MPSAVRSQTLGDLLRRTAARLPDKPAIRCGTTAWTFREFDAVVNLAAQAGVRFSMEDPWSYVTSNLTGHLAILEIARDMPHCRHLVYASSSSVYGANRQVPFREEDRVDTPLSLYAATKRADELMSHAYSHLYGIRQTGLRFFTVYGPWGRPDMAYFSFARAILNGEPVTLYDGGRLRRAS